MSNVKSRLESVERDGYDFRTGDFISQGFTIFGKNAAMFIGFLLVTVVISIVLKFIPYLGDLVSFAISGALGVGYVIVAHKTHKNEYTDFSNFFDGFKDWLQLFLNTLIITGLIIIGLIPALIFFFKNYGFNSGLDFESPDEIAELIRNFGGLYFALYGLAILLLSIFVMYSNLFIVFDKMNAFDAIKASATVVMKNIPLHILFLFVWIVILIVSAIPLLLGLLVTVPAFYCSIYYAWKEITKYDDNQEYKDDLLNHLID